MQNILLHDKQSNPHMDLIIFLDINMPRMDGFEALKAIKTSSHEILKRSSVIMLSSSSRNEDKQKSQELGAFEYITKPSSLKEMVQQLNQIMQRSSMLDPRINRSQLFYPNNKEKH